MARTTLPAGGAVSLAAHVRRLVAIVAAIVVRVAHPHFLDAPTVLTGELGARVARPVV